MSVYTTLTLKEVQDFAAPYGLEVIDLIPISRRYSKYQLFYCLRKWHAVCC